MNKENESKEIQVVETKSPAELISMAVSSGADLEKLEGLLTLQERWEAGQAKKAYHKAMAQFKLNAPKIDKDKEVAYNSTKYKHASLGNVSEKINKVLSEHGLSASWTTHQNAEIQVTCKITHELGHSEETTLSAKADTSGAKNAIQAIGSAITYLQRYTLLSLTGLATFEDDDGKLASAQTITDEQFQTLLEWIASAKTTQPAVLKALGLEKMDDMTVEHYKKAIIALKAKVGK